MMDIMKEMDITKEELIEIKRRRLAAMTEEEYKDIFNQVCEGTLKRRSDEHIRQLIKLYREHKQETVEVPT